VVILVRIGAATIQKMVEMVFLGWVNKLAGIALYAALYILVLSVLLFFAEKLHLFDTETIGASRVYSFIQPWGPKVMDGIGKLIPLFRDMFDSLSSFFEGVGSKKAPIS
jgi:membrane protein required for colicin V production